MAASDTTGGTRVISLEQSIGELQALIHETELRYLDAQDPELRRAMGRRLLAIDQGRQALAMLKLEEDRRKRPRQPIPMRAIK